MVKIYLIELILQFAIVSTIAMKDLLKYVQQLLSVWLKPAVNSAPVYW